MDKKIIYEEVLKLEGGTHRKGFELLVAAIEKIINNPIMKTIDLYNELAKEFNDTWVRVERGLRYYIQCIILEGNKTEINKLKFRSGKTGIPNTTDFIKTFALYLKMNFQIE